jgi:threonine dehydratase
MQHYQNGESPTVIDQPPSLDDINHAAARIAGSVMATPCLLTETLSEIAGCRLHLKFENLQFTASFKERGALNRLLMLSDTERAAGVYAMSAGNHAQGVAYHARRLGIPATIFMPEGTPLTKISRTRDHGAAVIVAGASLADAQDMAVDRSGAQGLVFIHPYDDAAVIAGQGTLALEIIAAVPDLDILVVPIGGGGLIAGIAIAAKQLRPICVSSGSSRPLTLRWPMSSLTT